MATYMYISPPPPPKKKKKKNKKNTGTNISCARAHAREGRKWKKI